MLKIINPIGSTYKMENDIELMPDIAFKAEYYISFYIRHIILFELTTFQQKARLEVTILAKQFVAGLINTEHMFSPE